MAVIDLRGDVARSLASIGQSIGGIIDPDKASRKRFQELLASNPQLAAALGRIEREAPGTLKNILPFDIPEEVISGLVAISPSLAELQEDIRRPGLTPEAAGGELPPEVASALSEFARARTVGTTPSELALEPKRVAAAGEITQEDVTAGVRRDSNETFNYFLRNVKRKNILKCTRSLPFHFTKSRSQLRVGCQHLLKSLS